MHAIYILYYIIRWNLQLPPHVSVCMCVCLWLYHSVWILCVGLRPLRFLDYSYITTRRRNTNAANGENQRQFWRLTSCYLFIIIGSTQYLTITLVIRDWILRAFDSSHLCSSSPSLCKSGCQRTEREQLHLICLKEILPLFVWKKKENS